MSKTKMFGIGLAGALSLIAFGCAKEKSEKVPEKSQMTEKGIKTNPLNEREDISVHWIERNKDYVKSINCLLSLYKDVIPFIEKNAPQMGISRALNNAYMWCRKNGKIKENSIAYSFVSMIQDNYVGTSDLTSWKKSFLKAGQEAEKILSEGDSISRKFVPKATSAFRRQDIANTSTVYWKENER